MSSAAEVVIKYDNGVVVQPDEVTLAYEQEGGPDHLKWTVQSFPEAAVAVVIRWDEGRPVEQVVPGAPESGNAVIWGLVNTRVEGNFKYEVLFLAEDGRVVANKDPRVRNLPYT